MSQLNHIFCEIAEEEKTGISCVGADMFLLTLQVRDRIRNLDQNDN